MSSYRNLAPGLSREDRNKLASRLVEQHQANVDSRRPRMVRVREIVRTFSLEPKPKTFPFHGCANVMLPIMTAPVIQHASRIYDMVYSNGSKLASVYSPSYTSGAEADLAQKYFNHYLLHEIPEFAMGFDASLSQCTLVGSSFRRARWDRMLGRVRAEWIPFEDFVAPAGWRSKDPSMSDLPNYAVVDRKSLRQIKANKEWVDTDELTPASMNEERSIGEEQDRTYYNTSDPTDDSPRIVLDVYFHWDAPSKGKRYEEFDGESHPAYACIDMETGTLFSLGYREEDDPDDLERYAIEYGQFNQARALHSRASLLYQSGVGEDPGKLSVDEPKIRQRAVPTCTHYSAFPSDGFYGLGIGDFLLGIAKATNTIANQSIDSETVRIAPPMFINNNMRGPKGAMSTQPGQFIGIDVPMNVAIKDGLHVVPMPPASQYSQAIIQMMQTMTEGITGAASTMAGKIPGSNQAGAAVLALIEEAKAPITVSAKRIRVAFAHELNSIWRLLGTYLPDSKMVDIIGDEAKVQNVEVSRRMFGPDSKVYPTGDPRPRADRIKDSETKLKMALENPIVQVGIKSGNESAIKLVTDLSAELFRATGDERAASLIEQIKIMKPPSPGGPPPGGPPQPGPTAEVPPQ